MNIDIKTADGADGRLGARWSRLQYIALDEEDFPAPRKVFQALAGLIDRPERTTTMDCTDRCVETISVWECASCG